MKKYLSFCLLLFFFSKAFAFEIPPWQHPYVTTSQLLVQAQAARPQHVRFAKEKGAQIIPTPDGKSYFVLWYPKGSKTATKTPPMIVTFGGHGGFAQTDFSLWQPLAEKYGFGILAVQWWFGQGEQLHDYYSMHEIYPYLSDLLKREGVRPGTVLAHGFSRGSANIYPLAYLDTSSGNHFFAVTLANAGKLQMDFPENGPLLNAGADVFGGTHWMLFCGMKDVHPSRDGCQGMTETKNWLSSHGATIDLFIQDPEGDHGGFHRNSKNIEAALQTFQTLL